MASAKNPRHFETWKSIVTEINRAFIKGNEMEYL